MAATQYFTCNDQPKTRKRNKGDEGEEVRWGGSAAEARYHHFGYNQVARG
jgi:hypothetical protein